MPLDLNKITADSGFQRLAVIEEIIRAGDSDDGERRVKIAVSSEEPVDRWYGREILDHGKKSVDLKFMRGGTAPLLLQHNHDQQIGVIESITLGQDRKLRALVRLGKGALATEVWDDIKDGIRANVSVGYRIRAFDKETDDDGELTGIRVTDWMPFEASIVSVPADTSVGVGRSTHQMEAVMPDPVLPTPQSAPAVPVDIAAIARAAAQEALEVAATAATARAASDAEVAETRHNETVEIMELGANKGLGAEARAHVDAGGSLSEFRGIVINKLGDNEILAPSHDVGLTPREIQQFSIGRLISATIPGASRQEIEAAKFEREAVDAVDPSQTRGNGMPMPPEIMRNWITPDMARDLNIQGNPFGQRVLAAGTDTTMVGTDHLAASFIDVLRTNAVLMQAGMRTLPGMVGDVSIPRKATASAVAWLATEGANSAASEPTFDAVTMTPKDLSVSVEMTRRARQQMTPAIEGVVRLDIVAGMALGIDLAGLEGSGASGQPEGVLNITGVNAPTAFAAVNPTFAEVVAMETAVADDNALMGSLAYVGRSNMRGALKTTAKDAGSGLFVLEHGQANGYPYLTTNQVTDGNLYFGNWAELMMGMWGGLDLIFDDATAAASNGLWIRAFQTVDIGARHPVSFAFNNDGV